MPGSIESHVAKAALADDEMVLVPTFRLAMLIHSRSANAEWLYEIAHKNPLWLHPTDAARIGVTESDLVRVETEIGHFVLRPFITEGLQPGVVACSHHMGRWKLKSDPQGVNRWQLHDVDLQTQFTMNQTRAEEITMREDYGNINLDAGKDDDHGD